MSRSSTRAMSEPDAQGLAGPLIEKMRLLLVQTSPHRVPGPLHVPAGGATAQQLLAELQVDDVVRAERLDDVRLDRDVAVGRLACDHDALRTNADRELVLGLPLLDNFVVQLRRKLQYRVVVA